MRWIQYLKSLFICMWQKYKMFYALYFLKLLNVFGLSIVELVSQYHQLTSSLMITVCRWWRKNRQFLKISQKTGTWYVYNRLAFKTVDQNVQSLDIEQMCLTSFGGHQWYITHLKLLGVGSGDWISCNSSIKYLCLTPFGGHQWYITHLKLLGAGSGDWIFCTSSIKSYIKQYINKQSF